MDVKQTATLEIISDVVCPWCYIGKRRFEQALELLDPDLGLTIHWRAYELNPNMPLDGVERRSHYARKFGSKEEAQRLLDNITANAHNDGLAMDYEKITQVPNTIKAHRLIWYATQRDKQNEIVNALFEAYFVTGRNIGDQSELVEIAREIGLDPADAEVFLNSDEAHDIIEKEILNARQAGIQGVPAFVVDGQYLFSGAQSPETISLSIKRAVERRSRQAGK
jgi:predicted DsbA family dithiol-disulfide isomerase